MPQDQAADACQLSGKYLGEVERREVNATILVVAKLADAFQVNLHDLLLFDHIASQDELMNKIIKMVANCSDEERTMICRILIAILKRQ
ncbi:helix-turn-helix domain-containing protein [Desulfovibrio desulfuricans]|uniref:helix-turn-helix domain-containing protein n=1 Tax=unclassified Desulfovibrio TaxID=2593640 RepID=UPI0009D69273